ncbi:GntR family transcriptional regulator [Brevibacillus humidisoli]|uniref:GntR family transcriptional regulator n=1 Tax=Brevibacillus humidisoli TaxID=2895522 RepID=UPI001E369E75|nr:GntR family transcriptional regulator [Brevibacillus humidisoli]UFJ41749.1 GntR family transcriptional regulator [Brevibacillus humidisoli]
MEKGVVLQTDPSFTFSLNTQIKEQLKWMIGIGAIKPGELLPPASQLADRLKVNRNTVNLVYTQLRDEGIVAIQKGRGTQVVDGPIIEALKKTRTAMHALLESMFTAAEEQGLDLYELVYASCAFVQLHNNAAVHKTRILFIECREHDHLFYKREVERCTHAEVRPLFLEDLVSGNVLLEEALTQSDVVVTTLNHDDEVKALLSAKAKPLFTIGATADMAPLLDIARMDAGSRVAFVCLGKQGGQWMLQRVKDAGIQHIESFPVGADNKRDLRQALDEADQVYASSAVYHEMKNIAPNKVKLFPLSLEKSSENLLKNLSHMNNNG